MKRLLVCLLLTSIWACTSSGKEKTPGADSFQKDSNPETKKDTTGKQSVAIDSTLAGSWQLQRTVNTGMLNATLPTLNFDLANSTVTGTTGCNNLSGSFTIEGKSLVLGEQLIVTKKDCPGYNEKAFLENLTHTNNYSIKNGVLELKFNNRVLSRWTRVPLTKDSTNRV